MNKVTDMKDYWERLEDFSKNITKTQEEYLLRLYCVDNWRSTSLKILQDFITLLSCGLEEYMKIRGNNILNYTYFLLRYVK